MILNCLKIRREKHAGTDEIEGTGSDEGNRQSRRRPLGQGSRRVHLQPGSQFDDPQR